MGSSPRDIIEQTFFIQSYCQRNNIPPEDGVALSLIHMRAGAIREKNKLSIEDAFNFSDELIAGFVKDGNKPLAYTASKLQNDSAYRQRISELYTRQIILVLADDFKS
jgi:hypothetical protein